MSALPLTIAEAGEMLRSGAITSEGLVSALYLRANRIDPKIGAYLYRTEEGAYAAAKVADDNFKAGIDLGPLQGIPIGVKDIIATDDAPTTANSLVLDPAWGTSREGPVIKRLRAAGAVLMGKLVTSEFACGPPDWKKPFPIPRNPWRLDRSPAGSSAGTGVGVAAGLFLGGLGTDTGGSVRLPSAWCGISGMKQTFGRVPKAGVVPLGYSLDHVGPMARSAWDCAAMLTAMAGYDASDPTSIDLPVPDYMAALSGSVDGLKIAVERKNHTAHPGTDPAVTEAFEAAVSALEAAGAKITEVEIPHYAEVTGAGIAAMVAEAAAYHMPDLQNRWDDYGQGTSFMLSLGAFFTTADFVQIQRARTHARRTLSRLMADFTVLLTPTTGTGALPMVDLDPSGFFGGDMAMFTPFWNVVGYPAMSIPMGFDGDGLPLGLQICAKPLDERSVFRVADTYQRLTNFHLAIPPLAQEATATAR